MERYDHYIAVDWSQKNMAIARLTNGSSKIKTIDVPADINELKLYLENLRGTKILTFEETTTSQWLYTELREKVDEIVICDPYRNRLLSDGPKTDRIDAEKLVELLRAGLLKRIFHSTDRFIDLRKLVSGYEDVIKAGVRVKNQRAALFRAKGKDKKEGMFTNSTEAFVLEGIEEGINTYESRKKAYEKAFEKEVRKHKTIAHLDGLPGIGVIGAIKIAAVVVDPRRFADKGKFFSFSGLVKHEKISGGRSYGQRKTRYSRTLKSVFKTAAIAVIEAKGRNSFQAYYQYLLKEKGYPEHNARHALARRIAVVALGVMKSGKRYEARRGLREQIGSKK